LLDQTVSDDDADETVAGSDHESVPPESVTSLPRKSVTFSLAYIAVSSRDADDYLTPIEIYRKCWAIRRRRYFASLHNVW